MRKIEFFPNPEKLELTTGLAPWLLSIKSKVATRILSHIQKDTDDLDGYIECVQLKEVPRLFVLCSFFQADINDALTRMGLYLGAGLGLQAGTLVKQDDSTLLNYKKLVAGHNLAGSLVRRFFASAHDLNPAERAVRDGLLPRAGEGDFYVIGFSIQSTKDQLSVISHEIYHAFYHLEPTYREVVQAYWGSISESEREGMRAEIGKAYNTADEDLVLDEVQAYLVQKGAEHDRLKAYSAKHSAPLRAALAARGHHPLHI